MKLGGYRTDGTLRVQIPGGMTVLLKGDLASRPLDDMEAEAFGPWVEPDGPLSWGERQQLAKQLDRSHVVPLQSFALQFPFQKKKAAPEGEDAAADTEVAAPKADGESGGPAPKSKPLTKGDLLARITEIAQANKAKADADAAAPAEKPEAPVAKAEAPAEKKEPAEPAAPKLPRSTLKRLKLEFESEDREGGDDEKKKPPVSEVAESAQEGETQGPPTKVPDHLQPLETR